MTDEFTVYLIAAVLYASLAVACGREVMKRR